MTSNSARHQPPSSSPSRSSGLPNSPRPSASSRHNSTLTTANGVARSPSLRAARGSSRPVRGSDKKLSSNNTSFLNFNVSDEASEDDARAEHNSVVDELKDRLQKAEIVSEEYQRQLDIIQKQLDDSRLELARMEESFQKSEAHVNELEDEKVHLIRQKRDMENQIDSERTAMARNTAEQKTREEELNNVISRLRISQRELRANSDENKETASSRMSRLIHRTLIKLTSLSSLTRRNLPGKQPICASIYPSATWLKFS